MTFHRLCAAFSLLLFVTPLMAVDEGHQHHAVPGTQLGKVDFPTSCAKSVQKDFERSVAALHSFWYDEAERSFNAVAAKDPECAMAYWGVAMSLHHPLWAPANATEHERAVAAVAKARKARKQTEREKAFVEAVAVMYDLGPAATLAERNNALVAGMEKVYSAYPKDVEAAIFYALALRATAPATDKTYAVQKKVGTIIDPLFAKYPGHPGLAHYVIHNYDYPALASRALDAAKKYAKIAPAAAHALHMPSHIFIRMGMWPEAIQSNLDSAAAARKHVDASGSTMSLAEEMHAFDYLAYAYLQRGEAKKAQQVWEKVQAASAKADWAIFSATYAASAMPARIALERRQWADAAKIPEPKFAGGSYWTEVANGQVHWARAVGAARSGNPEQARADVQKLTALRDKLKQANRQDGADSLEILRLSAEGWIEYAGGKKEEAVKLLRASAELEDKTDKHPVTPGAVLPAREQLADLLSELGQHEAAISEYEATLKDAPNRFNSLLGAARAAERAGNAAKSKELLAKLKETAPEADAEMLAGGVVAARSE